MQEIKNLLKQKGYPDTAIAAILGNIDVETGGSFSPTQKQRRATHKAYGLFQFDPKGMLPHYKNWLKEEKRKDNAASQVDFFHSTIYGDNMDVLGARNARRMQAILETADVPEATEYLAERWFKAGKPMMEKRLASADKFFYPDENPNEVARFARPAPAPIEEEPSFVNKLLYKVKDLF